MGHLWEQREFGNFVQKISKKSFNTNQIGIEYEDLEPETGNLLKPACELLKEKDGLQFEAGDVLFGKLRPYLKHWYLAEERGIAIGDFWVLRPENITTKYLYYLLQTNSFMNAANQSAGSKMPRSDWNYVSQTNFSIPTNWEEMEKIGTFFRVMDDSITLHQRELDLLKEQKKGLLQKLFPKEGKSEPELRFPGFTEPWEQREFGNFVQKISKKSFNTNQIGIEYEDLEPETGNLLKPACELLKEKDGLQFEAGDVLFGKLRPYLKHWYLAEERGIAIGDFWVLRPENITTKYLYYLLQTNSFMNAANQSAGSKMPRSDWNYVSQTNFSIPTNWEEMEKIGTFFRVMDDSITLHQRQLDLLKEQKKGLLQKMFPKEGENEPELRFPEFR